MRVLFIGGGNMAGALIGGLIARGADRAGLQAVDVAQPARQKLAREFGVETYASTESAPPGEDVLLLAVKPQQMREAARGVAGRLRGQLVITIAAGIRTVDLSRWLQGHRRIVRAMPNTPALVRRGIAGLYAMPEVDAPGRDTAQRILGAVGEVLWFDDETLLDAVTAVSGSGPAYVFYFIEALQAAARSLGIAAAEARRLAIGTFVGAAQLAADSNEPPETLRARVTSKGGTTERAVAALESRAVKAAIAEAVRAADARARQLGEEFGTD
ncbi:MAG TPA: pyrroline-5-carboxylate reductase [Burkholderiales bacterium]|nr:pyrroline-5-carboxylate reductase [Burkholderiales bacterium]